MTSDDICDIVQVEQEDNRNLLLQHLPAPRSRLLFKKKERWFMFITSIVRENTMDDYAGHGHTNSHDTYPQGMMSTDIMETDQAITFPLQTIELSEMSIFLPIKRKKSIIS